MTKVKWLVLVLLAVGLGLAVGCGSDSDSDSNDDGGVLPPSGSYAGTWTGRVCGRGVIMTLTQSGTTLSGNFTFTDPTFQGTVSGTVSSTTPPATARLNCGGRDWWFEISFASYNQFTGGFYKPEKGGLVCNVSATK